MPRAWLVALTTLLGHPLVGPPQRWGLGECRSSCAITHGAAAGADHEGWASSACVTSAGSEARASEATCHLRLKGVAAPDKAAREATCPGGTRHSPSSRADLFPLVD